MKINETIVLNDTEYKLITTKHFTDKRREMMLFDGENRWEDAVLIEDVYNITLEEEAALLGDEYEAE